MKVKSSLIAPAIAAALLAPTVGTAIVNHTTNTTKTAESVQKEGQHESGKGEKQKVLTNIINQYATPQLKDQLTKDIATRENLLKQLRQTPGFQKQKDQEKAQRQAFYKAHKQEIDAIKQQVKDGKLTKKQAHQKIEVLTGNQEGKEQQNDNGKEQGKRAIHQELKVGIQKKAKKLLLILLPRN